jgi:hypothetical protein
MTGRSQGSKNFAEEEVTALVALLHELKPAGAAQWDKLGLTFVPEEETWSIMAFSYRQVLSQQHSQAHPKAEACRINRIFTTLSTNIHLLELF